MSRRPAGGEQQFGSDSFLDVLANMVGILIILIVIAGLRLANNPLPSRSVAALPPETSVDEEVEPDIVPPVAFEDEPVVSLEPLPPEEPDEPVTSPASPPPQLVAQLNDLQREQERLAAARDAAERDAKELARRVRESAAAAETAQAGLAAREAEVAARDERVQQLEHRIESQEDALTGLIAEFEQVKSARPPSKEIKHRVTPIGRMVTGPESHFQILGGKIAYVPVQELEERLKSQLERQKEWLSKFRTHQGTVGPINGFSMNYVVERTEASTIEQQRHGIGVFRLRVGMWKIVPETEVETETPEQALKLGSRFQRTLGEIEEGANLTFWVYPDSFGAFRTLQRACQKRGFQVSGRPLPEGVPITASPSGSKSVGQ
jgi:hypothetical protein